jgi:hypothetical protein
MQERDAFAFSTDPWNVIDQSDPFAAAAFECSIQVVDSEADVVNAGPPFGDELANGGVGTFRFEEFDNGLTSTKTRDASSIGIVELFFGKVKQVAIER